MMLALLAFEVTIYRHQELYRLRHDKLPPATRTLFHDITRRHLDDGVLSCIKYFLNYFFYKFGLEVRHSHDLTNRLLFQLNNFLCYFSLDLLPVGRKCDWSENGCVCCWPRLRPHRCPIASQQEVHCVDLAQVLLLPCRDVVFPVPAVHRLPPCGLQRYELTLCG